MENIKSFSYVRTALELMPPRAENSNKSTFGRVLCVCGSRGMAGAAVLCARAVLRVGAGLAEVLTTEDNRAVIQTAFPEAIVTVYGDNAGGDFIGNAIHRADVIICGCGLGVSKEALTVLSRVLREHTVPLVLDADALNLLSLNPSLMKYAENAVITPHPGEMSRLTGKTVDEIQADRERICRDYAAAHKLVCVLKGHRTVVSDGTAVYVNTSGNSGMATAGAGDVLAGIVGGILAQARNNSMPCLQAAALAVYVHGLCGDVAAERLGEYSVIASDLISALPNVLPHRR